MSPLRHDRSIIKWSLYFDLVIRCPPFTTIWTLNIVKSSSDSDTQLLMHTRAQQVCDVYSAEQAVISLRVTITDCSTLVAHCLMLMLPPLCKPTHSLAQADKIWNRCLGHSRAGAGLCIINECRAQLLFYCEVWNDEMYRNAIQWPNADRRKPSTEWEH